MVYFQWALTQYQKTTSSFLHKRSKNDDIPLLLLKLKLDNCEIKWTESIKFLGFLLDENLIWKSHIKYIGNKIAKVKLFKAKPFLNKQSLLSLYYSYIHSYINYANVAWGSTHLTNLKILFSQQKHAMHIICNKGKFEHTKQLLQSNKIIHVH